MSSPLYDRIGTTYTSSRRADPRIERAIHDALGDAQSVLNVGAGAGGYEPTDREVVAVEPSPVMIAQRPAGAARVVRAAAERLPFDDGSFDAAMAVLSDHHWEDRRRGLEELRRVARRRVVLFNIDPARANALGSATEVKPVIEGLTRTFEKVYRDRALAFSIDAPDGLKFRGEAQDLTDLIGNLPVAACLPERFAEVARVTTEVLHTVARDGITEAECRIAKGSLRGGLVLGLEDSGSRMNRIGRSELNYAEHRSIDRTLQELDEVTVDEVNAAAHRLLGKPYGVAVLGPHQSKKSLPQQLRAIAR